MMKHFPKITAFVVGCLALSAHSAPVENFGQNLSQLNQAFANRSLHILQIGDSHTAGDYFTEQLRKRLQAEIGDGGIGFAYAGKIRNQRTARHDYQNGDWDFVSSRNQSGDYALGGMVGSPSYAGARFSLTSQYYAGETQLAKIIVKGRAGQTISLNDGLGGRQFVLPQAGWQVVNTQVKFPAELSGDVSVGGFWLTKGSGGVVSAMGMNGALQSWWGKWRGGLSQDLATSGANLVILAYGTNEAFASNYNANEHRTAMHNAIMQIKQGLPNANILLINAPESLKSTGGQCGTRGVHLDKVRQEIRQMAQQHGTLYWDWQSAMGGACSMKSWINDGLAAKDGVHFTKAGYERSANDLYAGLRTLLNGGGQPVISGQVQAYQTQPVAQRASIPVEVIRPTSFATPSNQPPKKQVCVVNGQPCHSIR